MKRLPFKGLILGFVSVVLVVAGFAWCQAYRGRGRVKGVITDTQGNPLADVTIKLWLVDKDSGFQVKSNKNGQWKATFIRGGQWAIDFTKPGYAPKKISIHLNGLSKNEDLVIKMAKLQAPAIPKELLDDIEKSNKLYQEGKYQEDLDLLNGLIAKYPDLKVLHWNVANALSAMGNYDKAIEDYMIAKEDYPNKTEFWMAVGNTYLQAKHFDKAMEAFKQVGIDKVEDPTTLYNLSEVFFSRNMMDMAIRALERAVTLKPDFQDAWYMLGTAYYGKNDKAKAKAAYEHYLTLDSTSQRAKEVRLTLESLK